MTAWFKNFLGSVRLASGKRIKIQALSLKQCLVIEQCYEPIAAEMASDNADVIEIYSKRSNELIQIVAVATGTEPDEVGTWAWDEFTKIFGLILKRNQDFFYAITARAAAKAAEKELKTEAKKRTG